MARSFSITFLNGFMTRPLFKSLLKNSYDADTSKPSLFMPNLLESFSMVLALSPFSITTSHPFIPVSACSLYLKSVTKTFPSLVINKKPDEPVNPVRYLILFISVTSNPSIPLKDFLIAESCKVTFTLSWKRGYFLKPLRQGDNSLHQGRLSALLLPLLCRTFF